jgi:hypothetical protein
LSHKFGVHEQQTWPTHSGLMPKQEYLRPHDVSVLLQLSISQVATYRELAAAVGLSLGESHAAVKRLELARLVLFEERSVNRTAALEFLISGVPYAFPATLGPPVRGIPTAFSGPLLAGQVTTDEVVVWPAPNGIARGVSLVPLSPSVVRIWEANPKLYGLLTLVDALRVGRSRERKLARQHLERRLGGLQAK